jgi:SAM-dependent methyltransferase
MSWPERIVPDETEVGVVALHVARYQFAESWCRDKVVLDLACGVGYGTERLARIAARAVGVDADPEAIAYARSRYARPNVEFAVMDAASLELESESFDVVCAFEAIEHLADPETALAEVRRVLKPTGSLLVSTPHARRTTYEPKNPWHRVEYSLADFELLLGAHFETTELYGQRRLQTRRHRALQRIDVFDLRRRLTFLRPAWRLLGTRPTAEVTPEDIVITKDDLELATELIAICTGPRPATS